MRCRVFPFALKGMLDGAGAVGGRFSFRRGAVAAGIGPLGAFARPLAGLSFFWRRQINAGPASFRQTDGNRLLGRSGSVLAFANVLDRLPHELSGLRAG